MITVTDRLRRPCQLAEEPHLSQYPDVVPGSQQGGEDDDALYRLHLTIFHHQFSPGHHVKTSEERIRSIYQYSHVKVLRRTRPGHEKSYIPAMASFL